MTDVSLTGANNMSESDVMQQLKAMQHEFAAGMASVQLDIAAVKVDIANVKTGVSEAREMARVAKHDVAGVQQVVGQFAARLDRFEDRVNVKFDNVEERLDAAFANISEHIDRKCSEIATEVKGIAGAQQRSLGFFAGAAFLLTTFGAGLLAFGKWLFGAH